MANPLPSSSSPVQAGRVARFAISLLLAANTARILTDAQSQAALGWYTGLTSGFVALFALMMWRPSRHPALWHAYFGTQCVLVMWMLALNPEVDTVTAFFIALAFQAPLVFTGKARGSWIGIFVFLTAASLILGLGMLQGLAMALPPIAVILVVPAFMLVNHETEAARARSQRLVQELEGKHRETEARAGKVEELAAMQERNRLARQLHDRVSQLIFSIVLTYRSAQLLLEKDPGRARSEIIRLQEMTTAALGQLRALISEMRP